MEVPDVIDLGSELAQDLPGIRALERQGAVVVGDVLDLDPQPGLEGGEIGEVGLGCGEEELVLGVTEDHAVLDDPALVVTPCRVVGLPRAALANVTGEDTGEIPLGVRAVDAVLVEGRGVDDGSRVADGEVLELVRHLIAIGGQIARPMAPEPGLVGGAGAGMERCLADHLVNS